MEENLKDKLLMKKENGWKNLETRDKEAIFSFCNASMHRLAQGAQQAWSSVFIGISVFS